MFNIKQFLDDELIVSSKFVEFYKIPTGPYKNKLFWGQHLDIDKKFEPHGFGLLVDEKLKIIQLGTFKQGKESGQQRLIQCLPLKSRYFTQFTSQLGRLNGPALIERADGRVEIGNYVNDKKEGLWKNKYLNGTADTTTYRNGKAVKD